MGKTAAVLPGNKNKLENICFEAYLYSKF